MKPINQLKISVIGLGYVGLPLAIEFGKYFRTVGFDINRKRIMNLIRKLISIMKQTLKILTKVNFIVF